MSEVAGLDQLLKAQQVAKALNVSRNFAYQLMRRGEIPTVRIKGARRVALSDLQQFIEENTKR